VLHWDEHWDGLIKEDGRRPGAGTGGRLCAALGWALGWPGL